MKKKAASTGERIRAIRGEKTQAEFGELFQANQGTVSAWERDDEDRAPSSAVYFRLAAIADDPEDSIFFLQQAGLEPDAVISAADALLKKGDVKMDAILATAENKLKEMTGDQKELEDEGKVVLVPPFREAPVQGPPSPPVPVPAWKVANKASTYYIEAQGSQFARVGTGVAPGDLIVFDASDTSVEANVGEEVVIRSPDGGLSIGRLGFIPLGSGERIMVLAPADELPNNWNSFHLDLPNMPIQRLTLGREVDPAKLEGQRARQLGVGGEILGRFLARFSGSVSGFWKRMARGRGGL